MARQHTGSVVGATISILVSLFILGTFWRVRRLRRHPNSYLALRAACNLLFVVQFVLPTTILAEDCHTVGGGLLAFVAEASFAGSELCFAIVSWDLITALTNPFSDYRASNARYRTFIAVVSVVLGLLVVLKDLYGARLSLCWVSTDVAEDAFGWLVFLPVALFLFFSVGVSVFAHTHLKKGLPEAFRTRKDTFQKGRLYVGSLTVFEVMYWVVTFTAWAAAGSHVADAVAELRTFMSLRAVPDFFVWVVNNREALLFDRGGRAGSALQEDEYQGQPYLNVELRKQVLYLTTLGIKRSVERFQNQAHRFRHTGGAGDSNAITLMAPSPRTPGFGRASMPERPASSGSADRSASVDARGVFGSDGVGKAARFFTSLPRNATTRPTADLEQPLLPREESKEEEKPTGRGTMDGVEAAEEDSDVLWRTMQRRPRRPASGAGGQPAGEDDEGHVTRSGTTFGQRFSFVDYATVLFWEIRRLCGISPADYLASLAETTKERFSEGASGAFLYFSRDEKFIVKTCTKDELQFLLQMLESYKEHLRLNPESLITRFLGAYSIEMYGQRIHFVVMGNVFQVPSHFIHERYDLKGSWVNRNARPRPALQGKRAFCRFCNEPFVIGDSSQLACRARPNQKGHVASTVLKDNDLYFKVRLTPERSHQLSAQIAADASWLCSQGIMDYSLLLGVQRQRFVVPADDAAAAAAPAPGAKTKTPFFQADNGGLRSPVVEGPAFYYFGIIDILQAWDWRKKLERAAKIAFRCMCKNARGISAVPPEAYARRFKRRVAEEVLEEASLDDGFDVEAVARPSSAGAGAGAAGARAALPRGSTAASDLRYTAALARIRDLEGQLSGANRRSSLVSLGDAAGSLHDLSDTLGASGDEFAFEQLRGRVVLAVNIASACDVAHVNLTELAALHAEFEAQGLSILAFPCNQFAGQEPLADGEAEAFVERYGARYPVFAKGDVFGENARPIYVFARRELPDFVIDWNYAKVLFDARGKAVAGFASDVKPSELRGRIAEMLSGSGSGSGSGSSGGAGGAARRSSGGPT